MFPLLFLAFFSALPIQESPPAESHARFVDRRELPNDLNLPFHENGFTVVAVTFVNTGTQAVTIDTAKIRVLDSKNKPLVTASASEITPKMVKSGARVPAPPARGPDRRIGAGGVYRPGYGRIEPGVGIGGSGGVGTIDLGRVERLKAAIENYQLKSTDVLAGEKVEGYLYLKTDKEPEKLKGTRILLTEEITLAVE